MNSWKNNLTTKLNTEGIFVGKSQEKFYNIKTKEIDHGGSKIEVTLGRNAKTNLPSLIDWKLVDGEPVANINDWLRGALPLLLAAEAKPSENPNTPSPPQEAERLGDPHE